jgi:hypothetical protein
MLHGSGKIDGDCGGGLGSEIFSTTHFLIKTRRADQCLGRDAAGVQADSTQESALDQCDFEAQLRRLDGLPPILPVLHRG